MRYHFEKPPIYLSMYGQCYICDHPVYNSCTLFLEESRGLAVIQQRFDPGTKAMETPPFSTQAPSSST